MQFQDRTHAGKVLARKLASYRDDPDVIILALPRGGVPVAFEVAKALNAPLDVFVVRKLGIPGHEEYAMGAIASGGVRVMNPDVAGMQLPESAVEAVAAREQKELERRERLYRGNRAPLELAKRIAILVDDGLATGSTMRAAAIAVKRQKPLRCIVAVPVAAPETANSSGAKSTKSYVRLRQIRFERWVCGTRTSRKPRMTKCTPCSPPPACRPARAYDSAHHHHGRRGMNRMLLGSDAGRILCEAPVPVLLVRGDRPKRRAARKTRTRTPRPN
jgi:putative phosphoribosyl transferase